MKIKLNAPFQGHKIGSIIHIADKNDIPIRPYWRRRLHEAESDNCIEIIKESESKAVTSDDKPRKSKEKSSK